MKPLLDGSSDSPAVCEGALFAGTYCRACPDLLVVHIQRFGCLQSPCHYCSNTHTHTVNGPFSGTARVSQYLKGKTNLDFTESRDSEWQWHQLGRMQVCTSFSTDNHASTPPLSFLQARCPSCRPNNSVKALKTTSTEGNITAVTCKY